MPATASHRLVSLIDLVPTMLSICGLPVPAHLQGQPFLDGPERDYVFATRDRYDAAYDMVRAVLGEWRRDYDVYGDWSESEMVRRWWPEGRQPQTAAPIIIPISRELHAQEPTAGGELRGPVLLQLHSATQGAAIGWTTDTGDHPRWRIYTGPLRLEPGSSVTVRAKAIRIGYKESVERVVVLDVY